MAKIAVIVPIYNVEKYLVRCIDTILNQSFDDLKLILVNDGSTDASGDICDEYKEKDVRIKVIHQENKGLSMARNAGIEASNDDYITFVDGDDYIHKDMLKILYRNMNKHKGEISACQLELSYEDDRLEDRKEEDNARGMDNIEAINMIVEHNNVNMIIAGGKLYKRELFDGIKYPKDKYHEDEFVTYKLLYQAKRVVVNTANLYYYTQRDDSITGSPYSLKRLEKLEALKEAIDFFKDRDEKDLELKARIRYLMNLQIAYYKIKYELTDEEEALKNVKVEYDEEYANTVGRGNKIAMRKRIMLKFFKALPNRYCAMVNRAIKSGKKVK